MDEKKLMDSKQGNIVKYVCLGLVGLGILALVIVWSDATSSYEIYRNASLQYKLTSMFPYFGSMTLLPMLLISAILFFATSGCSINHHR